MDGILTSKGALRKAMEGASGQNVYPGLQKLRRMCYVYDVEMAEWTGKSSIEV